MPICDMHHQGNLLRVIIPTLDLILRLQSVVLGKINNWKYSTTRKCISAYSKLLILPSCQVDMLNILMCLFNKFLDEVTNLYLLTQNYLNIKLMKKHKICSPLVIIQVSKSERRWTWSLLLKNKILDFHHPTTRKTMKDNKLQLKH